MQIYKKLRKQSVKSMGRSSVYKFISSERKPTGTAIEKYL